MNEEIKWLTILVAIYIVLTVILFKLTHKKLNKSKLILSFAFNQIKIKGDNLMVSLTSTQYVESGDLQAVDRLGRPAEVETGSVQFNSSDESVFQAVQNPDNEKQVKIVAVNPGVAQLNFSADADLGEGVITIEGFAGVEVLPAQAAGFSGLSFGQPQEQ